MYKCLLIFLMFVIEITIGVEEDTYKVAVIEYLPLMTTGNSVEIIRNNTAAFIGIADKIPQDVDLIIFPEGALTLGSVPSTYMATELPTNASENICESQYENYTKTFKDLACCAIRLNSFLIVSLWTKEKCTNEKINISGPCPSSGFYLYNTNVVFNNNAQVVTRYHKRHVFGEIEINTPEMQISRFKIKDTYFGLFAGMDILFYNPGLFLSRELGVSHMVYTSYWKSELPFLTALQVQQMWAYENNVVLLSSGTSYPDLGAGGSGIYLGKQGPVNQTFLLNGTYSVLMHDVPVKIGKTVTTSLNKTDDIDETAKEMDTVKFQVDPLNGYKSILLDLKKTYAIYKLCHSYFCCFFEVNFSYDNQQNGSSYVYHLLFYNGRKLFGHSKKSAVQVCAIVACLNATKSSCGLRFANYSNVIWPVTFHFISIQAEFNYNRHAVQFPNSLLSSLRPIHPSHTKWTKRYIKEHQSVIRTFNLTSSQSRLMTFAIYGRDYKNSVHPSIQKDSTAYIFNTLIKVSVYGGFMTMLLFLAGISKYLNK